MAPDRCFFKSDRFEQSYFQTLIINHSSQCRYHHEYSQKIGQYRENVPDLRIYSRFVFNVLRADMRTPLYNLCFRKPFQKCPQHYILIRFFFYADYNLRQRQLWERAGICKQKAIGFRRRCRSLHQIDKFRAHHSSPDYQPYPFSAYLQRKRIPWL